jgi:hypothetical protein
VGDPYTIRIFVPNGEPEGLRLIDRMNWTGLGIVFPREGWIGVRQRPEFAKPGVYILIGYVSEDDDLPTIYIGQGDVVRTRIDSHAQNKEFWSKAVVLRSSISPRIRACQSPPSPMSLPSRELSRTAIAANTSSSSPSLPSPSDPSRSAMRRPVLCRGRATRPMIAC